MQDLLALYGTDQPPAERRQFAHGAVSFTLQDGALRHLKVGGVEIIRGVAFLLRDRDWGTVNPGLGQLVVDKGDELRLTLPMRFETATGRLDVALSVRVGEGSVTLSATGEVDGVVETNRAGFTVLHPIDGVAGAPATVTHSDGSLQHSRFPDLIAPWQPFLDITGLSHRANGFEVSCAFQGDVFEMEDQRQWGDASFKTYNRPLALPWPYQLHEGEDLRQSVGISWRAGVEAAAAPILGDLPALPVFPEMALLVTAGDAAQPDQIAAVLAHVAPQRLLCHVDAVRADVTGQFAAFAGLQRDWPGLAFDLELICRCDPTRSLREELRGHAADLAASGLMPASIFVCPAVDRQSTPPGSHWPDCPPLEDLHRCVAELFPGLSHGGGMASFFPELNRKRPPVALLDFITHGLCPIVHAADDQSVIETLETIPRITASARAIADGRAYRLGPATIAMRQNPYGTRTIPNPQGQRVCMADDDPRHRAAFGGAYALGLATALAPSGVAVWTPASVLGPRGLLAAKGSLPLADVLRELARLAGRRVDHARIHDGLAVLELGNRRLRANLSPRENHGLAPFGWECGVIVERVQTS